MCFRIQVHILDEYGQPATSLRDGGSLTVKCTQGNVLPEQIKFYLYDGATFIRDWTMTTEGIHFRIGHQDPGRNGSVFPGHFIAPGLEIYPYSTVFLVMYGFILVYIAIAT